MELGDDGRRFESRHRKVENTGEIGEALQRRTADRMKRLAQRHPAQSDRHHVGVDVALGSGGEKRIRKNELYRLSDLQYLTATHLWLDDGFDCEREDIMRAAAAAAAAITQLRQDV